MESLKKALTEDLFEALSSLRLVQRLRQPCPRVQLGRRPQGLCALGFSVLSEFRLLCII